MSEPVDQIRTVRLAFELRIEASAQRTFEVMTQQSLDWFPVTCGEDRVRRVVLEPRAGGQPARTGGTAAVTSTGGHGLRSAGAPGRPRAGHAGSDPRYRLPAGARRRARSRSA
jgi:hypothetical protein